jgi:tripartite-type tricarboxylate transporter receptor subunit TctC
MFRIIATAALLLLTAGPSPLQAQAWPSKTVTWIVPFAPGGSSDVISRMVALKLAERIGQSVVVDNKPGGAGVIAMQAAQRATPDGHTIILGHIGTMAVNPFMLPSQPYDVEKDFITVSLLATVPSMIGVHPGTPINSLKDLLVIAKEKPGTINYGTAGNGSAGHLAMEYFKQEAGLSKDSLVHVPYRGTGPMMTDLLGGQTQATFTGAIPLLPHIKSGKVRPIAVGTAKRLDVLPDVPTVAEMGIAGFETSQWYGVLAPAKTPKEVIDKLSKELAETLKHPDVVAKLAADGSVAVGSTPEAFSAFARTEAERWGKVVKAAGIKPD